MGSCDSAPKDSQHRSVAYPMIDRPLARMFACWACRCLQPGFERAKGCEGAQAQSENIMTRALQTVPLLQTIAFVGGWSVAAHLPSTTCCDLDADWDIEKGLSCEESEPLRGCIYCIIIYVVLCYVILYYFFCVSIIYIYITIDKLWSWRCAMQGDI